MLEVPTKKEMAAKEPITFNYSEGKDNYMRIVKVLDGMGGNVCTITSSPGHCCAVTILGNLTPYGFWGEKSKVNAFVEEMKEHWRAQRCFRAIGTTNNLSIFNISGFYVYLSKETAHYDEALRKHPDIKLVHTFTNKRCVFGDLSYQGNKIDLYYMEFK